MLTSGSDDGLRVRGLTAGYGPVTVVRDVTLEVGRGDFVGVLGANGAGKTTLLRALVGDARVTAGSVTLDGRELRGLPAHRVARAGVAVVPEGRGLVPELSVRDNLLLGTATWNRRYSSPAVTRALAQVHDRFPVLGERAGQLAGSLSGGEQQMVAIGRALMARPTLLVLDEPSLGLAPRLVRQVFADLAQANRDGITVLVAEQNAAAALRVATRSYVMHGGRVVTEGTAEQLKASGLRSAFLGEGTREHR